MENCEIKIHVVQGEPKPILFGTEMVRAILAGEKTFTRRIVKGKKPPYEVGDILYVQEKWCRNGSGIYYRTDYLWGICEHMSRDDRWQSAVRMNKDDARIFLRVKSIEIQRLQDMKLEDFKKEGIKPRYGPGGCKKCPVETENCRKKPCKIRDDWEFWSHADPFYRRWDERIHEDKYLEWGVAANPEVWVIEFERI